MGSPVQGAPPQGRPQPRRGSALALFPAPPRGRVPSETQQDTPFATAPCSRPQILTSFSWGPRQVLARLSVAPPGHPAFQSALHTVPGRSVSTRRTRLCSRPQGWSPYCGWDQGGRVSPTPRGAPLSAALARGSPRADAQGLHLTGHPQPHPACPGSESQSRDSGKSDCVGKENLSDASKECHLTIRKPDQRWAAPRTRPVRDSQLHPPGRQKFSWRCVCRRTNCPSSLGTWPACQPAIPVSFFS
jgi:hypothetical protein